MAENVQEQSQVEEGKKDTKAPASVNVATRKIAVGDVFAFDHGYSGMKAYGETTFNMGGKDNYVFFPTYVVPYVERFGQSANPLHNIVYQDDLGKFLVGQNAVDVLIAQPDLYKPQEKMARDYIKNHKYLVAFRTAVALSYLKHSKFRIPLAVTGLPSDFVDKDAPELEKILKGTHKFQFTFMGETKTVEFNVNEAIVIPQPYGTFSLFAYDRAGKLVRPDIMNDYTRIHDFGFKTTDPQLTHEGVTVSGKCFSLVGEDETVSKCYEKIADHIYSMTGKVVPIFNVRSILEKGEYTAISDDLEKKVVKIREFAEPIFRKTAKNVIKQVIVNDGSIEVMHNILSGGGAGVEWILDEYKRIYDDLLYPQMEGIEVEPKDANMLGYKNFGMNAIQAL